MKIKFIVTKTIIERGEEKTYYFNESLSHRWVECKADAKGFETYPLAENAINTMILDKGVFSIEKIFIKE